MTPWEVDLSVAERCRSCVGSYGAWVQPIPQHKNFLRAGKTFAELAKIGSVLDLPDELNLPTGRPLLFAGNHRSLFDLLPSMAIFAKFDLSCRILIRADLMEKGPLASFLNGIGCVPASKKLRAESEATATAALSDGQLVCLMPEGRIVKPEELVNGVGPARPGVSRIACAANALVIPVAFAGTEKVWPRGSKPKLQRPRPKVTLRLGDPIDFGTEDHEANAATVMSALADLLATIE